MTLSTEAIFDLQACKTLHICFVIGMKDFIHVSDFYDAHFPVLWNIFLSSGFLVHHADCTFTRPTKFLTKATELCAHVAFTASEQ